MPPKQREDPRGPIQVNLRLSAGVLEQLDAWVDSINVAGAWPKVTRTDVLRRLVDWGVRVRPAFEGTVEIPAAASTPVALISSQSSPAPGERHVELDEEQRPRRR